MGIRFKYRWYRLLTSSGYVFIMTLAVMATLGDWALLAYTSQASATAWGLTLLLTSVAAALVWAFIFVTTYYADPTFVLSGILALHAPKRGQAPDWQAVITVLCRQDDVQQLLARLEISIEDFAAVCMARLVPKLQWKLWQNEALLVAQQGKDERLQSVHLVAAWLLHPALRTYLKEHDIAQDDVLFVVWWVTQMEQQRVQRQRWWKAEQLLAFMGVGLSWTSGYTPFVDRFSRFPQGDLWDHVLLGREEKIDQLLATLARARQSNVLVVGQPGSGRLGVVREVAARVTTGTAYKALNGQRVLYIHLGELMAQGNDDASQMAVISLALQEMERAGNIIAVFDGLSSLVDGGGNGPNMTSILLPFFASRSVRVVVIISNEEYHLHLKNNEELIHFFEVIQIESVSAHVALQMLAAMAASVERETEVYLPYPTLKAIVEGTESILPHIPYPERAFDILEEALVVAGGRDLATLSIAEVDEVITRKVGVPVGRLRTDERAHLLNLETAMRERVVNQRFALSTLTRAMIRARTGVRDPGHPIGTFLFLGPTGVGKTETAKTLAKTYFGEEDRLLRLDMSEFQTPQSAELLIGNAENPNGRLTTAISDKPFAVLLLDEFEKAHATVHQLFLQVFDEGRLTDARGNTVSFTHAIIIATSNAGAEFIHTRIQEGPLPEHFDLELREHILTSRIFRPELLNRFDGVITFTPLSPAHIQEVAVRLLQKLNKRLDEVHGVTVAITPELVEYLCTIGYHPEFGARPMARAIQDTVEYAVAQQILEQTTIPGQSITLTPHQLSTLAVGR